MEPISPVAFGVAEKLKPRIYYRAESVVFLRTNEPFGGLSNMAAGYPLEFDGIRIRTSEALYQACRFPHLPNVQEKIITQNSPMTAKMVSKPFRAETRDDWERIRVRVMRWCLQVKLAQHLEAFGELLLETGDKPIVEQSRKDSFWGAKAEGEEMLTGTNILGRLLVELREGLRSAPDAVRVVLPPRVETFLLFDRPLPTVTAPKSIEAQSKLSRIGQPKLFSEV